MKHTLLKVFVILFLLFGFGQTGFSQANALKLTPENEKKFNPYMWPKHGGPEGLAEFKKFYEDKNLRTCKNCGSVMEPPPVIS